jgi:hypothetical protein
MSIRYLYRYYESLSIHLQRFPLLVPDFWTLVVEQVLYSYLHLNYCWRFFFSLFLS